MQKQPSSAFAAETSEKLFDLEVPHWRQDGKEEKETEVCGVRNSKFLKDAEKTSALD